MQGVRLAGEPAPLEKELGGDVYVPRVLCLENQLCTARVAINLSKRNPVTICSWEHLETF